MKNIKNRAFTLVELIIVITILAILAVIAFISYDSYSKNARDASRMSTLTNIDNGLKLFYVKTGSLPNPEKFVTILNGITSLGHQGIVGDELSSLIKYSKTPTDPYDGNSYTYLVNEKKDSYQLLGYLENPVSFNHSFIGKTYANSSSFNQRYKFVKGQELGILIIGEQGGEKAGLPIQELYNESSFTGINIVTFNGTLSSGENIGNIEVVLGKNNSISGTGNELLPIITNNYKGVIQFVFAQCPTGWGKISEIFDTAAGAEPKCGIDTPCSVCKKL